MSELRHSWNAAAYHRASDLQHARAARLLELLDLNGDETVLDAGCGSGRVTELLLERLPEGRVIAVDSSDQMVAHARELLGDRATVLQADLTELELDEPVDAVFSNYVFHWVLDQARLFERMHAALRPGGTLAASCGAPGNLAQFFTVADAVGAEPPYAAHLADFEPAWIFPTAEDTEAALLAAGFSDAEATVDSLEEFPADPAGYARTAPLLCYLARLPDELHDQFVDDVVNRWGEPYRLDHVQLRMRARR